MSAPGQQERDRRFLLCVYYQGPWGRLSEFLIGVRPDSTLRWEIPADPRGWRWLLGKLADITDRREAAWRRRHAARDKRPSRMWKRRAPGAVGTGDV